MVRFSSLRLGDGFGVAGDTAAQGCVLAPDLGLGALQGEEPGHPLQSLAHQFLHGRDLGPDQLELGRAGIDLLLQALVLRLELDHALGGDLPPARADGVVGLEQPFLVGKEPRHCRLAAECIELGREDEPVPPRLLGLEPGDARLESMELVLEDRVLGAGADILQGHQRIAGAHGAARLDVDGADDPAFEVLDGLALAFRADHAGCDGSAGERDQPGPGAAAAEEQENHRPAEQPLASRRLPQAEVPPPVLEIVPRATAEEEAGECQHRRQGRQAQQPLARGEVEDGAHEASSAKSAAEAIAGLPPSSGLPCSGTTLARRAARTASTSSRGPKATTSPFRSMSRRSISRRAATSWVITTSVVPRCRSATIVRWRSCAASASAWESGSSSTRVPSRGGLELRVA